MKPAGRPRPINSVRVLCALARDHGVGAEACLEQSGIAPADLESTDLLIGEVQELQVVRNLLKHVRSDRSLGLEAGFRYHPTTFGAWGFAILSSQTARQAVEVGVRYIQLTATFCKVWIEEDGHESMLVSDAGKDLEIEVRRFLIERDVATAASVQRDVIPVPVPLTRLEFQFPAPADASPYEKLFRVTTRFGQPLNRIGVRSDLGDMKLPQGDVSTLGYCEAECRRLLDLHKQRGGLAENVRERLIRQTRLMPSMPEMAAQLAMSVRTLRRRLAAEGTDYESLAAEVRRSLAEELLGQDVLSVEQIAERLGYAEVASFSRAFKRWTGMSPRAFRAVRSGCGQPPAR